MSVVAAAFFGFVFFETTDFRFDTVFAAAFFAVPFFADFFLMTIFFFAIIEYPVAFVRAEFGQREYVCTGRVWFRAC